MRENRPYGSEGGEAKSLPYPYHWSQFRKLGHWPTWKTISKENRPFTIN
jgi:hypothetical protein